MMISLLWFAALTGCMDTTANVTATQYTQPEKVCNPPSELLEISGITDLDDQTVACVQDEQGTIYYYDLNSCAITRQFDFEGPGDFEGLTRVGQDFYALRSDGTVYKIKMQGNDQPLVTHVETRVPAADNESLCYDDRQNRLLISPKDRYTDSDFAKDHICLRFIQ